MVQKYKCTDPTAFWPISTTDECILTQFNVSFVVIKTWIFVNLKNSSVENIIFNVPSLFLSLFIGVINCFNAFWLNYRTPRSPLRLRILLVTQSVNSSLPLFYVHHWVYSYPLWVLKYNVSHRDCLDILSPLELELSHCQQRPKSSHKEHIQYCHRMIMSFLHYPVRNSSCTAPWHMPASLVILFKRWKLHENLKTNYSFSPCLSFYISRFNEIHGNDFGEIEVHTLL